MTGWGIFLAIMGAGSLLLPMLGYQFRLMELVDPYQPYAGIVVAVIGAALIFMGMNRGQATVEVNQAPATPADGQMAAEAPAEDPYRRP